MQGLLAWFDVNARPLPWRTQTVTPWESLLAEIILQQTRLKQAFPTGNEFEPHIQPQQP